MQNSFPYVINNLNAFCGFENVIYISAPKEMFELPVSQRLYNFQKDFKSLLIEKLKNKGFVFCSENELYSFCRMHISIIGDGFSKEKLVYLNWKSENEQLLCSIFNDVELRNIDGLQEITVL